MAKIFVSHIHEEAKVARAVRLFLGKFDLGAFLSSDRWQILPGERWFDRIVAELTDAEVVILLLSERSVIRPWINFEAGWGWAKDLRLIPVCFGGLTKDKMPRPYSDLQAVNLRTDYYDLLMGCGHVEGFLPPPRFSEPDPRVSPLIQALDDFEGATPPG